MVRYCYLCKRNINAKRRFGMGTLIMVLLTWGIWLLVLPFYNKKCPICHNIELSKYKKDE